MTWQQILLLAIVLAVAAGFVWRSSGSKKHEHGCGCGCDHDHEADPKKEKAER